MLFFTDRNCFLTAVRVYDNAGFDYSWRLKFPLIPESCDFIEDLFSDYGSPVLERVDSKKDPGKRLVIPASAEYFAAAFSDPDWHLIYAVVFSRKPLPDREHCRCQRNDPRANPICRLNTIPEDVIFKPLEGKKERRKFIQFSLNEESSCALAHTLLRAVTTKNMETYDILFRLTELWKFCDNKFLRIFANCLTEAWQKTFHENPPVPFLFNPAESDFRKCISSVASPEDFLEDLKAKREKWLLERPVLQKFFAENPAESGIIFPEYPFKSEERCRAYFRHVRNTLLNEQKCQGDEAGETAFPEEPEEAAKERSPVIAAESAPAS